MSEYGKEWSVRDFEVLRDSISLHETHADASLEWFGQRDVAFRNRSLYHTVIRNIILMEMVRRHTSATYVDIVTLRRTLHGICRSTMKLALGTEMEDSYLRYINETVLFMLSILHASQ